jgi:hypothetical protein
MDGWGEYRKLVLAQLERLDKCVIENERKLDALRLTISELSAKAEANTAALARLSGALARLFWLVVGAIASGAGAALFKWLGR